MKKLPRVIIDGRMVGERNHGVSRYVQMIAKALADRPRLEYEPVFLARNGMERKFSGFETIEVSTPHLDPKEVLTIPWVLIRSRAKLFHSTSLSSFAGLPCPSILTLHDLVHLHFGSPFEKIYDQALLRPFSERVKALLTVSEFSKNEIMRWNPKVNPEVIYNAIDPQILKYEKSRLDVLDRFGLGLGKYFVCLSNDKIHKNAGVAVRAFLKWRAQDPKRQEYRLVVSTKKFSDEPGVMSTGPLKDEEWVPLVSQSAALLFPSLYEGFGLPPVEAAALGARILVSDILPHREALRELPEREVRFIYADHTDAWVEAMTAAAAGRLPFVSRESGEKIRQIYSVSRLGEAMDRVYCRVLGLE